MGKNTTQMKNLHLMTRDKFAAPYINFVSENFNPNEHLFLVMGSSKIFKMPDKENVKTVSKSIGNWIFLVKQMYKYEKIFIHGLFKRKLVLILFLNPWLLKKCSWIIWGGDLYWYKFRPKGIKSDLYESVRKFVIKRMGAFMTQVKGDYELAKIWYGAKGKYYSQFTYPSNLFKSYDLSKVEKNKEKRYIQIGNSAGPTNNHIEVFNKIKKFKDEAIEIICPLSYGNEEYRDEVIREGITLFGDKFKPIVDFMPFEKYLEILAKVDIAIFNHNRSQAMGNMITLLGLGKKVYIRNDSVLWEFCNLHELKVYPTNESLEELFEEMPLEMRENNIKNIKRYFSEAKLKENLEGIFTE